MTDDPNVIIVPPECRTSIVQAVPRVVLVPPENKTIVIKGRN